MFIFIEIGQCDLDGMDITLDAFQTSDVVILFLLALTMKFEEGKLESDKHNDQGLHWNRYYLSF
jgi:multiple antibiotic resistance protein